MNSDISSFIKQRERGKKGCRPRHWMGEKERKEGKCYRTLGMRDTGRGRKGKIWLAGRERNVQEARKWELRREQGS